MDRGTPTCVNPKVGNNCCNRIVCFKSEISLPKEAINNHLFRKLAIPIQNQKNNWYEEKKNKRYKVTPSKLIVTHLRLSFSSSDFWTHDGLPETGEESKTSASECCNAEKGQSLIWTASLIVFLAKFVDVLANVMTVESSMSHIFGLSPKFLPPLSLRLAGYHNFEIGTII